jgi:hypothetical protein
MSPQRLWPPCDPRPRAQKESPSWKGPWRAAPPLTLPLKIPTGGGEALQPQSAGPLGVRV